MDPQAAHAVNVVLAIFSGVAALIAGWSAWEARKSRLQAKGSVEAAELAATAAVRQADAAERSLRLQEKLTAPAPWQIVGVPGGRRGCVNNADEALVIVKRKVLPEGADIEFVENGGQRRYEPGQRFDFYYSQQSANPPHQMQIEWRTEETGETTKTTLRL